ncbi:MAG: hypothetical protein QF755_01695 [Candidatus Peribacteraceae bacterium]|nr:hypothetical protein [Candidatus Peribacteraceae bacterium]
MSKATSFRLALGCSMFALSCVFIAQHAHVLSEVQTVSAPLVAKLSELERREDALQEQVELSEIHAAVKLGSLGEKLDVYVLPKETDFERLIASWELLSENLKKQGYLAKMSDISFGDPVDMIESGVRASPMRVNFAVHEKGMEYITKFIRLAGLLTVGDAITDEQLGKLMHSTEEENPAGIVALEQFLSLDLIRYARDVRAFESKLKRSFTSNAFANTLLEVTHESLLSDARDLLEGDYGRYMQEVNLWPIQFVTLKSAKMSDGGAEGWHVLEIEILVWERT